MRIEPVGFSSYQNFISGMAGVQGAQAAQSVDKAEGSKPVVNPGESDVKAPGRTSAPSECETCKNRKYQDGSDENVSFKAAAHISPEASGARVRGHEQEHVSNAYKKAAEGNGKVIQASVSLKTAICPECGRSYVSGGTTSTKIKYSKDSDTNPYAKDRKAIQGQALRGQNLDFAV
ncbi:MAG: hypothetical protein Q4B53_06225 [Lachnospiraceae bacterium]|nr:hypothetical protein [Lachnospiraceae bacterium]